MNQATHQYILANDLDRPVKQPEPALRGDDISADRFISNDYAREEFKKVWMKTWSLAGMGYHVKEPGDFISVDIAHESIICVRGEDGAVRAFYNSCPHRGTRITDAEEGSIAHFSCPYHGWQFDHKGETVFVPNEEDFPQGSPCGKTRLKEIQCRELFGLVWINMDDNAGSLEDFLGPVILEELGSYHMENMLRVMNMTADSPCNWKIITDNFNEAYHVQVLHPGLIPYIEANYKACQFDLMPEGHNRGWFPSHNPSVLHDEEEIGDHLAAIMRAWNLDPAKFAGKENRAKIRQAIQQAKRELHGEKGYHHYKHYADYQYTDYVIYNIFPNTVITVGPDGVQLLRPRPHPSGDAQRCLFDHWWMVQPIEGMESTPSPAGGPDLPVEDAMHEMIVFGEKSLGTTADEDLSIAKMQQEGLSSAGFQNFYLPHQERRVQRFHEVLNDYMSKD
jgi:phenylpropionate dioxygenase-like ring-hydroxylating dioxygenase large terminal subunit